MAAVQSSLRDEHIALVCKPWVETHGYRQWSLRDGGTTLVRNPWVETHGYHQLSLRDQSQLRERKRRAGGASYAQPLEVFLNLLRQFNRLLIQIRQLNMNICNRLLEIEILIHLCWCYTDIAARR